MSKEGLFAREGIVATFGNISVVINDGTHPLELDILADTAPPHIAARVAIHPRTLRRTLAKLAENEHPDVRSAVGENRNTPVGVLWKLAQDSHPDVRYSLAENHNLHSDILKLLAEDDNPYIAARAQRTLERLKEAVKAAVHHEVHCTSPAPAARLQTAFACA